MSSKTIIKKFKKILCEKCPLLKVKKYHGTKYVSVSDLEKHLKVKNFLPKYFKQNESIIKKKIVYYPLANVMEFVHKSVNDGNLGSFVGMWRDPLFVVDFHKPMGWYDDLIKLKKPAVGYYSEQVLTLVSIIEELPDCFEDIRDLCFNEFELKNVISSCDFRVDYFINLAKPLIIEINEKAHETNLREVIIDEFKDGLNNIGYEVVQIYSENWFSDNTKIRTDERQKLKIIKNHIETFASFNIIKKIINSASEINDIVNDLGSDITIKCAVGDTFIFPLSKTLKKFGINKGTNEYTNFADRFVSVKYEEQNYDVSDDESVMSDVSNISDMSDNSDVSDDGTIISDTKETKKSMKFIEGEDFIKKENEYYMSRDCMTEIAIQTNQQLGRLYVKKVNSLINYILKELPNAYKNLLDSISLSFEQRKEQSSEYERIAKREANKEIIKLNIELSMLKKILNVKTNCFYCKNCPNII